jgi:hemerythrin-like domain-containing protein
MKRAPELRDLSDHHHQGLLQARRLRRAATAVEGTSLEETSEAFLKFWQEGTTAHFREEEEVLLPILARYGGEIASGPVVEMLGQHARIRGLVMELSDEVRNGVVRPATLKGIGELLETHIRLEEREVFPIIEETLPEEALKEVASRLKVKEAGPRSEPWVPNEELSYNPLPGPGDSEGGGYDWPL